MSIAEPKELSRFARQSRWLVFSGFGTAAIVLALTVWLLGLAAGMTGGGSVAATSGIDQESHSISLVSMFEPPQLDSTRTQDASSSFVLGHLMEGLLRLNEHNEIKPAIAESWEIREDGATFYLRHGATWSDGAPVTAHDFVFAWRLVADPKTASPYAFLIYPLKNAEAITNGELPPEALGVSAVGDYQLSVEFGSPVPYFDKLATFTTLLPIREDFYNSRNGKYGADKEDLLFNGPYVLADWIHGASYVMKKNPAYWDAARIRLDAINIAYITSDSNAMINLYRDGRVAMVGMDSGLGSDSLKMVLQAGWPIRQMRDGSVWYLEMNHRADRVTRNRNFRKALQLSIDKNEFVYRVLKTPGIIPADSIFPVWLRGSTGLFQQEYPPRRIVVDYAEARRYLEKAKAELGVQKIPPVTLLFDDTQSALKQAQYFQSNFREQLGIEVRLDPQIFKQRIAKMQAGDFDLVMMGWVPDYNDPLTFGDLFSSWNPNNRGRYSNPEVDRWVRVAQNSADTAERMAAFGRIQDLLIDDVALIPNYERGQSYVQDPRLKGVVRRAIGTDPDFTNAYIVPN